MKNKRKNRHFQIRLYQASNRALVSMVIAVCLSACAGSSGKLSLSDLGTRYWKGTYYLSVEGMPSSIQCDVDPAYKHLDDVFVRYKGGDALTLFDRDDDLIKIETLKQQCLSRSGAK
jgi:hypothetical protein